MAWENRTVLAPDGTVLGALSVGDPIGGVGAPAEAFYEADAVYRAVAQVAIDAIASLPGAASTASTCGLWSIFHASACSRPPPPTIKTRIATPLLGAVGTRR